MPQVLKFPDRRQRQTLADLMAPDMEYFRAKIKEMSCPEPNSGCWLWMGDCDRSMYGRVYTYKFGRKGPRSPRHERAHRVSYAAFVDPDLRGLHVCHKCDVTLCVNPAHLFLGTDQDNSDDKMRKGRYVRSTYRTPKQTHCQNGHELVEGNLYRSGGRRCCRTCVLVRTNARNRQDREADEKLLKVIAAYEDKGGVVTFDEPQPYVSEYLTRPLRTEAEVRALREPRVPKAPGLIDPLFAAILSPFRPAGGQ